MKHLSLLTTVFFSLLTFSANALAVNSVLSGVFDGSEPKTDPLPGTCDDETEQLGYLEVGAFQVSESGLYTITDPFNFMSVDITAVIYNDAFDPANPDNNLVTDDGVDVAEVATLNSGTTYVLVVQHYCSNPSREWVNRQGTWAVTFSGPGIVTSAAAVITPAWTEGSFSESDDTSNSDCGDSQYAQAGPIRVSKAGTYYYSDISLRFAVDMCLQVFTAPFDPANPSNNRVVFSDTANADGSLTVADDQGEIELVPGVDYYFVAQPLDVPAAGEYFYIFAPPSPFYITYAMSGSWFYPPTAGQGFLIDVFDTQNLMFLAWFTYDLERPPENTPSMIGEPGHRWMTAAGPTSGNTANLDITWSSGMIFDSESPPVSSETDGTMTVEFDDCFTGTVSYDLGSSGRTGTVPIERIVNDAVPLCETLTVGPGKPGPL